MFRTCWISCESSFEVNIIIGGTEARTFLLQTRKGETTSTMEAGATSSDSKIVQDIVRALQAHDDANRSFDFPKFYGIETVDTITPRALIRRIENAAIIGAWCNWRKCAELLTALYSKAGEFMYYYSRKIPEDDWDSLKEGFIMCFEPKEAKEFNFVPLPDLKQGPRESVEAFRARVHRECHRVNLSINAAHISTVKGNWDASVLNMVKAERQDAANMVCSFFERKFF